ncbi:MAG: beta-propeller domain-containing protein [Proteobacteria bacterium]|nr:beta-propeller domain-containing protein [Pseudomonadota bacterium]
MCSTTASHPGARQPDGVVVQRERQRLRIESGRLHVSEAQVLEEQGEQLEVVGRVGGLGRGEQIQSVRFLDEVAYVVTFRQTDPFYVVDLSQPTAPAVTGELKIPGFSTYLHPVGDDLLLGVGQDADLQGRVTGMQVSLFDLSDLSKPEQVDRLSLGHGWSPAGDDSRAFGYDPQRRTALLPFSVWDHTPTSVALGIRVEGRRLVEAGRMPVMPENTAERVLHDGRQIYTVSRRGVVAGSFDTFERTGAVDFAVEGGSATPR